MIKCIIGYQCQLGGFVMKLVYAIGAVLVYFLFSGCSFSSEYIFQEVDDSYFIQCDMTNSIQANSHSDNCQNEISKELSEFNLKFPYVSDAGFEILKDIYANINFIADFKYVDKDMNQLFADNFQRLIKSEASIYIRENMLAKAPPQYLYIHELIPNFDPSYFIYYLLDFTGDGNPDLGIRYNNPASNVFVISYVPEKDRFILWYSIIATSEIFIGPQRVSWSGNSLVVTFSLLDIDGFIETHAIFSIEGRIVDNEDMRINLVSIPYPLDSHDIPEYLKSQIVDSWVGDYMLMVTDEQFDVLFEDVFYARTQATLGGFRGRVPAHGHTFEELFGERNHEY